VARPNRRRVGSFVSAPLPAAVHIITQLELGGAQEIALLFCRHLRTVGFDVHLVAGHGGMLDGEARQMLGDAFHHDANLARTVRPLDDLTSVRSLTSLLRELRMKSGRPMIVHTHSSKAGIVGRWAAWLAGVEIRVHSIHGFGFNEWQPWWVRRTYQAAEQVTAAITHAFCPASEANRRVAEAVGLLRGDKPAVVLPEAIEIEEYVPREGEALRARAELGLAGDTPLVGMVACLKPQKAPLDFVKIAARVQSAHPQAHFFLAGDGMLRSEMESEIARCGLSDRFHLLGWRRDVRALLGAADILVLTSLWEGLPRAVLQGMAASKPIVATRVDGTPEAIEDGRNGFLLAPHDVDGFAERVARLIVDPRLACDMGREGRRRVDEFSVSTMLHKLERLYEQLIERRA
jgi:glycosyltransferase involved in cell wall biosynthesis